MTHVFYTLQSQITIDINVLHCCDFMIGELEKMMAINKYSLFAVIFLDVGFTEGNIFVVSFTKSYYCSLKGRGGEPIGPQGQYK